MSELLALAEKYLSRVKRSGPENIMAICPFHRRLDGNPENTPSFTLSITKGVYYCFSCHERGNLRQFLRAMGLSRLRIENEHRLLLEDLERSRPAPPNPLRPVVAAEPLPNDLLGLFDYCPLDLVEEGFDEGVLASFDIGFDKDHQRITFPLRDKKGQLIGISGRTTADEWPRYKVYDTEYELWGLRRRDTQKRAIVWNLHNVFPCVYFQSDQSVVIVEGFKGCMKLVQAGIKNTVALLGSYMSREQQWAIESLGAKTLYVMLDNDDAGLKGRIAVGRALAKSHADVRIVDYDALQPSDLYCEELPDIIDTAVDYRLWKIRGLHKVTDVAPQPEEFT